MNLKIIIQFFAIPKYYWQDQIHEGIKKNSCSAMRCALIPQIYINGFQGETDFTIWLIKKKISQSHKLSLYLEILNPRIETKIIRLHAAEFFTGIFQTKTNYNKSPQ
jgi:hypothetical protein